MRPMSRQAILYRPFRVPETQGPVNSVDDLRCRNADVTSEFDRPKLTFDGWVLVGDMFG